jgi:hypothetical protein
MQRKVKAGAHIQRQECCDCTATNTLEQPSIANHLGQYSVPIMMIILWIGRFAGHLECPGFYQSPSNMRTNRLAHFSTACPAIFDALSLLRDCGLMNIHD